MSCQRISSQLTFSLSVAAIDENFIKIPALGEKSSTDHLWSNGFTEEMRHMCIDKDGILVYLFLRLSRSTNKIELTAIMYTIQMSIVN